MKEIHDRKSSKCIVYFCIRGSLCIDLKRNETDPSASGAAPASGRSRRWHPYTVALSGYAGQTVSIIFETGAGPVGDEQVGLGQSARLNGRGSPRLLGR